MSLPPFSIPNATIETTTAFGDGLTPSEHYKIGISLAVIGNFLIAVSLNVQKYAHRKRYQHLQIQLEEESRNDSLCAPGSYMRSCTWWVGIILMVFGEVGNFIAYGFAPASVVAPLGCVAVIANGIIAVLFNNESLRLQDIVGASFALVGSFLIVEFSVHSNSILSAKQITSNLGNWQFVIYVLIELIILGIVMVIRSRKSRAKPSVMLHLVVVAILGSFTVISAKAVSGMLNLTIEGETQLVYFIFYFMLFVMAITTIIQVKYLNEAMANYDIAVVVPINFVLFTISAILAGAIFYQEFFHQTGVYILMFLFGCILSFLGVLFITGRNANGDEVEEGALHLDMMPAFIRSLALSFRVKNIQPKTNDKQSACYPDEETHLVGSSASPSCSGTSSYVSTNAGPIYLPSESQESQILFDEP